MNNPALSIRATRPSPKGDGESSAGPGGRERRELLAIAALRGETVNDEGGKKGGEAWAQ